MTNEENIRFSFRSNEHEVEVVIQGPPSWVNLYRERIGLEGDIGYTQTVLGSNSDLSDGSAISKTARELPGPPPDPSRLPSVVRVVGDLDVDVGVSQLEFLKKQIQTWPKLVYFWKNWMKIQSPFRITCRETQWQNLGFNL